MLFHVGKDALHGNGGLLTRHACVGHYQENDVTYRCSADICFLFHNNFFTSIK